MATLLIADHDGTVASATTRRAMSAARAIGDPVDVLVAGSGCAAAAASAAALEGVRRVLLADHDGLRDGLAEPLAALLVSLAGEYDTLIAGATASGKATMPRVAALLDVMQVSEIVAVEAPDTFRRPTYAGNAIETVRSLDAKRVVTVRTAAFRPVADRSDTPASVAVLAEVAATGRHARLVERTVEASSRPELTSARIVIAGGRAFQSSENFRKYLEPLADRLGAAIGASRAAVDAGFAPNELQVGQTGKVVAPDLYIACGISGAIQHLAGMKDSRVIVAINSDPDAPIFQVADYGLVGDIHEILPALTEALT